jgi:hypothetical protein
MLAFFIKALATWRLTELVVEDELTRPLREAVTKRWPGSRAAYVATCKRCVSVWAGATTLLLPRWMNTALAVSAATILANDWRDDQASAALARRMTGGPVRREGETGEV